MPVLAARSRQVRGPGRLALALAFLVPVTFGSVAGCGSAVAATCPGTAGASCVRVLFLGNSYTYVNDLPATLAQLARSAGRLVETGLVANGGETLAQHDASGDSRGAIASRAWNFVVLQEQSQIPAYPASREAEMYPAARSLAARIAADGATTLFYLTAAHRDGEPDAGLPSYEAMQLAINDGYRAIARELGAEIAPVGYAWFVLRRAHPSIGLWQDDGSHPTTAGTYLAACVFYAAIFRASPEGLSFTYGLSADDARTIQVEAARDVLGLAAEWNLR
jgi:hypothetical protein